MAVAEGRVRDAAEYLDKLKAGRAEFRGTIDTLDDLIRAQSAGTSD
jgi:hypothetical protein